MAQIIIIDDGDPGRLGALSQAFTAAGCEVIPLGKVKGEIWVMEVIREEGKYITKITDRAIPIRALAILRHAGEGGERGKIEAPTIYYGGEDPWTDRRIPDGSDRIYRQVSSEWGIPTDPEARELVEYLQEVATGKSPDKPSLLVPEVTPCLLRSLAILCQGYLLLHASGGVSPPDLFTSEQKQNGSIHYLSDGSYRHLLPPAYRESSKR